MSEKKKFVASFSTGKDSSLALYKAIKAGMEPVGLLTTYNISAEKAWFHGVPEEVLGRLSEALGIPIYLVKTDGSDYEEKFEEGLRHFKELGAEYCVFGDIDLEAHLEWDKARCEAAGLSGCFPLWQMDRKKAVEEFLAAGFTARITTVNTKYMDTSYLGEALSADLLARLENEGVDVCGENGEYHTLVVDGPLFKKAFSYEVGDVILDHGYGKLPVK